jgi:hypothetical protein
MFCAAGFAAAASVNAPTVLTTPAWTSALPMVVRLSPWCTVTTAVPVPEPV